LGLARPHGARGRAPSPIYTTQNASFTPIPENPSLGNCKLAPVAIYCSFDDNV